MPTTNRKASKPYRIVSTINELPKAFYGGRPSEEGVEAALTAYQDSGSCDDREALIGLFLPMVKMMSMVRFRRGAVNSDLDDLISDGCFAITHVVNRHAHLPLINFRRILHGAIQKSFMRGMRERTWAGATAANSRGNLAAIIRATFAKQHARFPTREEHKAALDRMIQNGQIHKDFGPKRMSAASAIVDDDAVDLLASIAVDRTPCPLYELLNREAIELARRDFQGLDLKLFDHVTEGRSVVEICKLEGLSEARTRNRINGLLWTARCRADVAAYLGVEPASESLCNPGGTFMAISKVPPARIAIAG